MKKITLLILTAAAYLTAFAQGVPDCSTIKLDSKEGFDSVANMAALNASTYLLSIPADKTDNDRNKTIQYLLQWMTATPEYSFYVDETVRKVVRNNDKLLTLYLAAATKYSLENKHESKNEKHVKLNSIRRLIQYAKDPKNNLTVGTEFKKAIKAEEQGRLPEYLKL
jgi:hypothetical protein